MKKIVIILIVSTFTTASFAQVSGGIKAGVNFSSQTISGNGLSVSPEGLTSFHGGLFLTAMFSEKFGLQPELLYSLQGSTFNVGSSSLKTKLTYLNIPV